MTSREKTLQADLKNKLAKKVEEVLQKLKDAGVVETFKSTQVGDDFLSQSFEITLKQHYQRDKNPDLVALVTQDDNGNPVINIPETEFSEIVSRLGAAEARLRLRQIFTPFSGHTNDHIILANNHVGFKAVDTYVEKLEAFICAPLALTALSNR